MGVGGSRMGTRLLAGLVALGAAWAFAAFAAGSDAADLFRTRATGERLGQPTDAVILALQEERRLSTGLLGGAGQAGALAAQRARTDRAHAALRRSAAGAWARWVTDEDALGRANELLDRLDRLPGTRAAVDAGRIDRGSAAADYTATVDVAFRVYGTPALSDDRRLTGGGRALIAVSRAREALAQQDAFVRGALATGGPDDAERLRLAELVGVRRFLLADAEAAFGPAERSRYRRLTGDGRVAALRGLEDALVRPTKTGPTGPTGPTGDAAAPPMAVSTWARSADPMLAGLRELEVAGAREAVAAATPGAVGTIVRAGLVVGLGFVALIAVLAMIMRAARAEGGLARILPLPGRRFGGENGNGENGDGSDGAAPGGPSGAARGPRVDGRLGALLHDLDRRNQALLHRQLRVLDAMERRESDDEDLGDLFRADHLATRMRRNVEKAITLAGGTPGRRWRRPVPLVDVARAAAAEVADFARVATSQIEPAALAGAAVTDVTHLLAELIENATAFAPAETRVRVTGERRVDGYALTVADSGPGLADDDLARAHEVMHEAIPPAGGVWWGLYAVGRFAARHGIAVALRAAPNGGLTAEVLIPPALVTEAGPGGDAPARGGRNAPARGGAHPGPAGSADVRAADTGPADVRAADTVAGDGGTDAAAPGRPATDGAEADGAGARTTASGLPTRVRSATISAAPIRPARSTAGRQTDRVARLRKRATGDTDNTGGRAQDTTVVDATVELPAVNLPPRTGS